MPETKLHVSGTVRPMPIGQVVAVAGGVRATVHGRTLTIRNESGIVWALLDAANGHRTSGEVVEFACKLGGAPEETVAAVFRDLLAMGVLGDSRMRYRDFHELTLNPMEFSSDMRIADYVEYENTTTPAPEGKRVPLPVVPAQSDGRASCRQFSMRTPSAAGLATILARASDHPPSAGALHPIHLGVVVNRDWGQIKGGVYKYDRDSHALVQCVASSPEERAYGLNREDDVYGSAAVIVISGDLERQTRKYANRGYRYTMIEAGIAADRIVATAMEDGLATLIFGGYDDKALGRLLYGSDSDLVPLITVAVGYRADEARAEVGFDALHDQLDGLFVGEGRLIEGSSVANLWREPEDLSFHQVLVTYRDANNPSADPEERTCGGSGASIVAARTKAIVEAVERHTSSNVRVDRRGTAIDVDPHFNVELYAPRTATQIASHQNLAPFDPELKIEWVRGTDLCSGEPRWLPIDLVYYPISAASLGRGLLDFANSNGVAAHTDRALAVRNALLERVERHAVLRSWYDDVAPGRIEVDRLGPYVKNRAAYWRRHGYELTVLDYSTFGVPVAGVAIASDDVLPAFAFGSAASARQSDAIRKALHEAEIGLAGYRALSPRSLSVDEVQTPTDHGWFHAMDSARTAGHFLSTGPIVAPRKKILSSEAYLAAVQMLRPISVAMNAPEPIQVVRILSGELTPIGFGVHLEYEHRRTGELPHFIA